MNTHSVTSGGNRKQAFTLIELLVVIAIISLLVSILLPSLQVARDLGKQAVCLNNHKTLGIGVAMYSSENDGWIASAGAYCPTTMCRPVLLLKDYIGLLPWMCAEADFETWSPGKEGGQQIYLQISYEWLLGGTQGAYSWKALKFEDITYPSQVAYAADRKAPLAKNDIGWNFGEGYLNGWGIVSMEPRHLGKFNCVALDGACYSFPDVGIQVIETDAYWQFIGGYNWWRWAQLTNI